MKNTFSFVLALLFSFGLTAQDMSDKSIVDIAASNPDFSTLVTAVKAADLAGTLSGDGPFTVFAPTNAAFDKLPDGLVNALVKPANKSALTDILKYHVVSGYVMAADVVSGIESNNGTLRAGTMNGGFDVMLMNGSPVIKDGQGNTVNITSTDIKAKNGVIHVVDAVLLPQGVNPAALLADTMSMSMAGKTVTDRMKDEDDLTTPEYKNTPATQRGRQTGSTVVDVAAGNRDFSTLVAAVQAAGYEDLLGSDSDFTIFAPTNDAFDKLPDGTVNSLTTSNDKKPLQGILQYHIVPSRITAAKLMENLEANRGFYRLQTFSGESLYAYTEDGKVMLRDGRGNSVQVIQTDNNASNGIIHAVDGVLMPRM